MIDIVLAYQQNLIINEKNRESIAIREIAISIKNMKNNQFDSTITRENQQKHEIKIKKKIHEFFENLDVQNNAN